MQLRLLFTEAVLRHRVCFTNCLLNQVVTWDGFWADFRWSLIYFRSYEIHYNQLSSI